MAHADRDNCLPYTRDHQVKTGTRLTGAYMSENDFHDLAERLGRVYDAGSMEQIGSGRLKATREHIVLELIPDEEANQHILLAMPPREVPERLLFADRYGRVGLAGCTLRRSRRKMALPSWAEIHADHAIEIKQMNSDFTLVNHVRSEVAGLATWRTIIRPVVEATHYSDDNDLITGVIFEAKAGDPREIGTRDGLRFVPYFSAHSSRKASVARHEIIERMFVETCVEGDPVPLDEHLDTHRKVQELLVIAYGRPCGQKLVSVSSAASPKQNARTGDIVGDQWRGAISTWCGRGEASDPMELPNEHPLFYLGDIGTAGIRRWVEESSEWARIIGPLVVWTFDSGGSIEVEVIQIAVALEALGHRIAVEQGLIKPNRSCHFPEYLELIGQTLNCDLAPVVKGSPENGVPAHPDYAAWSADFNMLYKQCKHADHPLPDGLRGAIAARSGALLLRMWLAQEFGVAPSTIDQYARFA